jgi:hypothetical protein
VWPFREVFLRKKRPQRDSNPCFGLERVSHVAANDGGNRAYFCQSNRLADQMSVTLLHALSRSDYLGRSQKRPQQEHRSHVKNDESRRPGAEPCRVGQALTAMAQTWASSRRFRVGSFLMALPALASANRSSYKL